MPVLESNCWRVYTTVHCSLSMRIIPRSTFTSFNIVLIIPFRVAQLLIDQSILVKTSLLSFIISVVVVEVKHGDILNLECKDWRDGDLVFVNSTCFDESLMNKIANIAGLGYSIYLLNYVIVGMKKGSFIVTLTKRLNSSDFQVLEYELHEMSWGGATVYIHQKTTDARNIEVDSDDDA